MLERVEGRGPSFKLRGQEDEVYGLLPHPGLEPVEARHHVARAPGGTKLVDDGLSGATVRIGYEHSHFPYHTEDLQFCEHLQFAKQPGGYILGKAFGGSAMSKSRGVTLIEIVVAMAVLAIAFVGLIAAIVHSSRANATNLDTTRAMRAAEQAIETMEGSVTQFSGIFPSYNSNIGDEGVGFNAYVGGTQSVFEVLANGQIVFGGNTGGAPTMFQRIDPDGSGPALPLPVGTIMFPEGAAGALDENGGSLWTNLNLGMPRDLNSNGSSTEANVSGSYAILPVLVRLQFVGSDGTRRNVEFRKIMVAR